MEKTKRKTCIEYIKHFKRTEKNEYALKEIKCLLESKIEANWQQQFWYRILCDFILLVKNGQISSGAIQDEYRHFTHVTLSFFWKAYGDWNQVASYLTKFEVKLSFIMLAEKNSRDELLTFVFHIYQNIISELKIEKFTEKNLGEMIPLLIKQYGFRQELNSFTGKKRKRFAMMYK